MTYDELVQRIAALSLSEACWVIAYLASREQAAAAEAFAAYDQLAVKAVAS